MSYWSRNPAIVRKFNPNHDEKGQFASGSGLGGYSSQASLNGDTIVTANVDDAVKALSENRKVELTSVHEVSTLMDKLRDIAKQAIQDGAKAQTYNLCNVSVAGTNLFCAGNKGVNRINMPQLKGKPLPGTPADTRARDVRGEVDVGSGFRKNLEDAGFQVTDDIEKASYLKATQNELNGVKVAQIAKAYDEGKLAREPLFVSKDNYIVDGHHRWAAMVAADSESGSLGHITVPIERVDDDIIDILGRANKYAAEQGIPQSSADDKIKKFAMGPGLYDDCCRVL